MGKLKGSACYLCGPIDYATDLGTGWRQKITPILREMGMIIIDPTNKPIHDFDEIENREYRLKLKAEGDFETLSQKMRDLRCYDLRCVDKADVTIVYIDQDVQMCGTWEEFFTANKAKHPCLVFSKNSKKNISDWVFGTIPHNFIFENIEEIIEHLQGLNDGTIVPDKRWVFFNWEKIING